MSIQCYVVALLFMTVLGNYGCQTISFSTFDSGKESRVPKWGDQIKQMLDDIIANGLTVGDFTIPPLDPLQINATIKGMDTPGIMFIEHANLLNTYITGIGGFVNNTLGIELAGLKIVFDLTINIQGTVDYVDLNVTIGETIPFYGDGTLRLNASIGHLVGAIYINGSPYITLKKIDLSIDNFTLGVHISNLMGLGETRESEIFNELIGEVTPPTLNLLAPVMINSLLPVINSYLGGLKLTVMGIMNCLNNPPCNLFG